MALEMKFGEFTPEGIVEIMLRNKEKWDRISTIIHWILQEKNWNNWKVSDKGVMNSTLKQYINWSQDT